MTRDYKTRRPNRKGGLSGGAGLAIGLAVGLAVAVVAHFVQRRPSAPPPAPPAAAGARTKPHGRVGAAGHAASAASATAAPKQSYDFYKMLPSFEVVVPPKTREVKPDLKLAPETRPGTYVLQAGAYKRFADADRVRAQLALQGIESTVQKVTVDDDTWHRIRIGPVSDLKTLNHMRDVLRRENVDFLVIRVGD